MTALSNSGASALWIFLLTAASTGTTWVLACATPFAALAALAAAHLSRRDGMILMLLAWGVSQAIGFGVHHYPVSPESFGWAAALLCGAMASTHAARAMLDRVASVSAPVRLTAAYVASFVAFKGVIALWSLVSGGLAINLDPALVVKQFARDGGILIGLLALYRLAVAIGLTLHASAYLGEIWRGSIDAVPRGQTEAAKALSLKYMSRMKDVILPQAIRISLPATVGFLVQLIKGTSLASIVGFTELTRAGNMISNQIFEPLTVFGIVGALYFLMCCPLTILGARLERRFAASAAR